MCCLTKAVPLAYLLLLRELLFRVRLRFIPLSKLQHPGGRGEPPNALAVVAFGVKTPATAVQAPSAQQVIGYVMRLIVAVTWS